MFFFTYNFKFLYYFYFFEHCFKKEKQENSQKLPKSGPNFVISISFERGIRL